MFGKNTGGKQQGPLEETESLTRRGGKGEYQVSTTVGLLLLSGTLSKKGRKRNWQKGVIRDQ